MNALVVSVFFVGFFLSACGIPSGNVSEWRDTSHFAFDTGPYIVLGDSGSAFVALKAELSNPPIVEWWQSDQESKKTEVRAKRDADLWVAKLVDLPATAQLSYRVRYGEKATPIYSFRVGVEQGKGFRFAMFGDTRTGHSVHRGVVEAVAREKIVLSSIPVIWSTAAG